MASEKGPEPGLRQAGILTLVLRGPAPQLTHTSQILEEIKQTKPATPSPSWASLSSLEGAEQDQGFFIQVPWLWGLDREPLNKGMPSYATVAQK